MSFQVSKNLVREYYQELDKALNSFDHGKVYQTLEKYTGNDFLFRGMHPFYEITDLQELADKFWLPFHNAIRPLQRRMDIFMAGKNEIDDQQSEWVCSMGHLVGNFVESWLGIPPSKKMTFLRYAEFLRVEEGQIVECAFFCDIISVMKQAGLNPLPTSTGVEVISPGPMTHDGLLYQDQDLMESEKTLNLINRMISDINKRGYSTPQEELSQTWREDMTWYGPSGIGASYTHQGYILQHQAPFRQGISDRRFNGHNCRFSEGNYGGYFGWSNLSLKLKKNFLGLPASDRESEMRVVDIYRRDGDYLAENWVLIDLLHFLYKLDLDILGRMEYLQYNDF